MLTIKTRMAVAAAALILGAGAFGMGSAQADLTIVSKVDLVRPDAQTAEQTPPPGEGQGQRGGRRGMGGPGMRGPEGLSITKYPATVTVSVKGENIRTEVAGGEVRIFNAETNQTYVLNTAEKTYYIQRSFQRRNQDGQNGQQDQNGGPGGPGMGGRGMQMDSHLTTAKAAGDSIAKSIAGNDATKYQVSGTIDIKLPSFGGRRGGPQGDQQGEDNGNAPAPRTITIKVGGEIWFADNIKLPEDKEVQNRVISAVLASAPQLREPIEEQIVKVGLLPVAAKLNVEMAMPGGNRTQKATASYEVTSYSSSDVDASLFAAPSDYTKVNPPAMFGGRRGRQGGGQGEQTDQGGAPDQGSPGAAPDDQGGPGGEMAPPPDDNGN